MRNRTGSQVGLALVLALAGFLVAVGFVQERLREEASPARAAQLRRLVVQRQETIRDLARQVGRLSDRVAAVQARVGAESGRVGDVTEQVRRLEAVAGLAAMRGPGLVIELEDSPEEPRTREDVTDLRIQDVDLQQVVNALWRAGAEAISINGRRLVGTTAIRKAGTAILVNYRAVSSPYRVVAIGAPEAMERRLLDSEIARRFDVWEDVYGLRFVVSRGEDLEAPPLQGLQDLRWASPEGAPE